MIISIDLSVVPPRTTLEEADDFKGLKVVVAGESEHVFITRDTFLALAGPAADSEEWVGKLDGMLAYAAGAGWVDEHGAVRAHVER